MHMVRGVQGGNGGNGGGLVLCHIREQKKKMGNE